MASERSKAPEQVQSSMVQMRGANSGHSHNMGARGWDAVVIDCFSDTEIPAHCKSQDFVAAVRSVLKPGGLALQHVFHYWEAYPKRQLAEYNQIMQTYQH